MIAVMEGEVGGGIVQLLLVTVSFPVSFYVYSLVLFPLPSLFMSLSLGGQQREGNGRLE